MANDCEETCPLELRADGFHPIYVPPGLQLERVGIGNTVVVAKGDALVYSSGAAALATDGGVTAANFMGVAAETAGSATAAANASTKMMVYPPDPNIVYWAKVETGTTATTSPGSIYDFETEDGLDQSDTTTGGLGFKCTHSDSTNNYMKGRFALA